MSSLVAQLSHTPPDQRTGQSAGHNPPSDQVAYPSDVGCAIRALVYNVSVVKMWCEPLEAWGTNRYEAVLTMVVWTCG